jgi:hypothetical protein
VIGAGGDIGFISCVSLLRLLWALGIIKGGVLAVYVECALGWAACGLVLKSTTGKGRRSILIVKST